MIKATLWVNDKLAYDRARLYLIDKKISFLSGVNDDLDYTIVVDELPQREWDKLIQFDGWTIDSVDST